VSVETSNRLSVDPVIMSTRSNRRLFAMLGTVALAAAVAGLAGGYAQWGRSSDSARPRPTLANAPLTGTGSDHGVLRAREWVSRPVTATHCAA